MCETVVSGKKNQARAKECLCAHRHHFMKHRQEGLAVERAFKLKSERSEGVSHG